MASASVSMALPLTSATQNRLNHPSSKPFLRPLRVPKSKRAVLKNSQSKSMLGINASLKEKSLMSLTTCALTASMVIPEMAQAAENYFSPSLKNFLLSIVAGGVVLGALFAAVIGVANFDPVKRT